MAAAASSVFVVPEGGGRAPPPALAGLPLGDASVVVLCLFLGSGLSIDDNSRNRLEQLHLQFHRHPQLLFVVLPSSSSSPADVWRSLHPVISRFQTLVVARFVTRLVYASLEESHVQRMQEVFRELASSATTLERALVQKECIWAEENASNYLITAKDLINSELQHPVAGAQFYVAGNMFLSAAVAQFGVFLDTSSLRADYQTELQKAESVDTLAAMASRNRLVLEASEARAEFVVTAVDETFDFDSVVSRSAQFFVVLLKSPNAPTADRDALDKAFDQLVLRVRDTLEQKRVGFDVVVLRPSSDDKDLLAALDCGLRNAKHSHLALTATRSDADVNNDVVSQDTIDDRIDGALVKIRELKQRA